MTRYPKRPWYHPIAFVNSVGNIPLMFFPFAACFFIFPFRFIVADYWEKRTQTDYGLLRQTAIAEYADIEMEYKRQVSYGHPTMDWAENVNPHSIETARRGSSAVYMANTFSEQTYWRNHARDVQRSQQLLDEIKLLKEKIQREGGTVAEQWE